MEGNLPLTYIIAEAGTGHYDADHFVRREKAWALTKAAKAAGADAVKFQAFFDEPLFCPYEGDEKRWERWEKTLLTGPAWCDLLEQTDRIGIDLLLSVFSQQGIALLKEMKPRYIKVASRAAKTFPYDELEGPFLVSTGMEPSCVRPRSAFWLQCDAAYPCRMRQWHRLYDGLSDHSGTIWPGMDAIFGGAEFLEVHFTIPGTDPGPDAPVCLTLEQLKLLTGARDAVATMRGNVGGEQKENTGAS